MDGKVVLKDTDMCGYERMCTDMCGYAWICMDAKVRSGPESQPK